MRLFLRSAFSLVQLAIVIVVSAGALAFTMAALAPSLADLWRAKTTVSAAVDLSTLEQTTTVFDANGELIAELKGPIDREYVPLSQISPEVVAAVLSVEDDRFYEHAGVNVAAITRAAVTNVSAGGIEQGGSTITQQLVKLSVVGDEQVLERKIPEAAIAMRLEETMTKDEILERYLNAVYFGGGAYGVQAAAELYFNKDAGDLNYGEAALLAGIISNPSLYDPVYQPSNSLDRRSVALGRLQAEGFIDAEERAVWERSELPRYRQVGEDFLDTYFVEEVKRQLLDDERLGATRADRINRVFQGGLEVYTTFDPVAQALAENAVATEFPQNPLNMIAGLVSVEPGSGAIRAMVGGPGFEEFEFNVTTQVGRQTGSSFKTFVLAAAFETAGLLPSDSINASSPCTFDNPGGDPPVYTAGDYNGGTRSGALTIEQNTLRSTNCAYLRLAQTVGLNNVIDTAEALGISSDLQPVPALPLGVFNVTPLEMANAYATIANDGIRVDAHVIERVESNGELVFQHDANPIRAVSEQTARLVTDVLEKNVSCSAGACTGRRAQLSSHPAAGKTGTGQQNYDAWFVGYTPQLATAVWVGNQDGQVAMRWNNNPVEGTTFADYEETFGQFASGGVTGGSIPAIIWGSFMEVYMEPLPVIPFIEPDRGVRQSVQIATDDDGDGLTDDNDDLAPPIISVSPCGGANAEVDQDNDGDVDWCRNLGGTAYRGSCPALLVPVDQDRDGTLDRCVAQARPEGSTDPNDTPPADETEGGEEGEEGAGEGDGEGEGGDGAEAGEDPDAAEGEGEGEGTAEPEPEPEPDAGADTGAGAAEGTTADG